MKTTCLTILFIFFLSSAHTFGWDGYDLDTEDYAPLSQYKAAERDFEYILRLIDLALAYFADGMEATGQVQ
ncbi:MAG: hypothetical protein NTY16_10420 [Deltaproteobacteria bacterium]|nr:hypothetical protein [Deltaproteobacteria bacterium]